MVSGKDSFMKKYFFIFILIVFYISCFGRIKTDDIVFNNAKQATFKDFFYHMTGNKWFEKMRNKNYYIFQASDEKYIYYGKMIKKNEELEIYKVDRKLLTNKFPNYRKLHGYTLAEIVENDYIEKNNLENNQIYFKESSFKLNESTIESKIKYWIHKENMSKELIEVNYELDCKDFSIIKRN